jgi:hypothetical protein
VHDDHTFNAELIVQAQHVFKTRFAWRVLAVCSQRVAVARPEHMGVAVTATGRQQRAWRLMLNAVDGGLRATLK